MAPPSWTDAAHFFGVNAEAGQLLFDVGAFGEQRRLLWPIDFQGSSRPEARSVFRATFDGISERLRTQLLYLRGGPFDIGELAH